MRRIHLALLAALLAAVAIGVAASAQGQSGSGGKALFGSLTGAKEVGAAGDTDARGAAAGVIDGRRFCWSLTVRNIAKPAAAHIHQGGSSANGEVVIPLKQPSAGDPGASSGCVRIAAALARNLQRNPGNYYWNVHTGDFPGGAMRGQVFAR